LLELETVATPLLNVMVSAVPKLVAVPVLLVTVGVKEPMAPGPPKVRLLGPVYPVAVLP
jgi:hypothetical protein